ncbi:hypothetical protein [Mucilaginibacter sp. FT3.2]|uniref:hypothetical protein n=1 Tax=Mucilaginibacter sp. FT3.2 TaxID=2723090 RepID=UPI001620F6FF|nr:hypothetical protein [Mucilaginibacter sp. FT3.2]MBB6235168.1 hypothetical protein [Mucilaginibacter sp. FT3.2]
MNAACKALTFIMAFCCLILTTNRAIAQAKNAIGVGPALGVSEDNIPGFGIAFQGEIRLNKQFSIAPSFGVEIPYVVYAGLAGRYYVQPGLYVHLGGFIRAGGDVFSDSGPGGTAGVGFIVLSTKRNVIDLNLHADVMSYENRSRTVAGMRITYNFSFTRLK